MVVHGPCSVVCGWCDYKIKILYYTSTQKSQPVDITDISKKPKDNSEIENINDKYDVVIKGEKEEQVNKVEIVTDEKGETEKIINVDENVTIAVGEPEQTIIEHEYEAKNPFEEEL